MGFFKKPKLDIRSFRVDDVILINGKPYIVRPFELQEIPVKRIGQK